MKVRSIAGGFGAPLQLVVTLWLCLRGVWTRRCFSLLSRYFYTAGDTCWLLLKSTTGVQDGMIPNRYEGHDAPACLFQALLVYIFTFSLQPPAWVGLDRGQLWKLDAFTASNIGHIIACHQVKKKHLIRCVIKLLLFSEKPYQLPQGEIALCQLHPSFPSSLICALRLIQLQSMSSRVDSSWHDLAQLWAETALRLPLLLVTLLFRVNPSFDLD